MKVLIITRTLAEFANIQGKLREISKAGADLTVVSPPRWAGSSREIQRVKPDSYSLVLHDCWLSGFPSVRVGPHLHFYPGISRVIESQQWDLVHIDEEPFNFATYHAMRSCVKYNRSAIFTTWQNLMKTYPPPFNSFEKYVFENSVGAIAGNAEALQTLRRRGFAKSAALLPQLGVDPDTFHRKDVRELRQKLELEGAFAIGYVGRLSPEKGLDTLIHALALLPPNCILVLVGSGPEKSKLEAMTQRIGVSKRVRWVPWVDPLAVPNYMNALDVLTLPSRTQQNIKEQFGRVLVEAMACETCVVGSDSGEIPNVIGDAGLVFHESNERELAEQLRRLMEDPMLRENLGRRGKERVAANFTYAKIARDTTEFYKSFCSVTDGPPHGQREAQIVSVSKHL